MFALWAPNLYQFNSEQLLKFYAHYLHIKKNFWNSIKHAVHSILDPLLSASPIPTLAISPLAGVQSLLQGISTQNSVDISYFRIST